MTKEKSAKEKSPLELFMEIQQMQFELDKCLKKRMELSSEIRSLSQLIPKKIRELPLR